MLLNFSTDAMSVQYYSLKEKGIENIFDYYNLKRKGWENSVSVCLEHSQHILRTEDKWRRRRKRRRRRRRRR